MENKAKKKIIGTGLTGLVGSRIVDLFSSDHDFENLSLETGINILDKKVVEDRILNSKAEWVFHFAAKTDVDTCEKDKVLGKNGDAWKVNVGGTENIINACKKSRKKILYISTDFVFDGLDNKFYSENDTPNPINWYGVTKYEAEKRVIENATPFLICRISFPYRASFIAKKDIFRAILERLKNNQKIDAVYDEYITPTFIDDIALGIKKLIAEEKEGIFHLNGSSALTPYEIALCIADKFNFDKNLIEKTEANVYFKNRAKRPFHAVMKNDKIKTLGVVMHTFDEGLGIVKKQMEENL